MFSKKFICIALMLLIIAIGAVSAEENITTELQAESINTFEDVQNAIDASEINSTITLNGTYKGTGTEITINKDITIDGLGKTTLDANHKSRILNITSTKVTLKNINFINAKSPTNGGAITSQGQLTIINCSFKDNTVDDGELYNSLSWYETFNNLGKGGAISTTNDLSIVNSTFINNSAHLWTYFRDMDYYSTSDDGRSGAIYCLGNLYLEKSYFEKNSHNSISANGSSILNCIFEGTSFCFYGPNNVSIVNSSFNKSPGIYCEPEVYYEYTNDSILYKTKYPAININYCNFTNGYSDISCENITINNSNFINNNYKYNGYSFIIAENAKIINSTFINNTATNAAILDLKKYEFDNCTFTGNKAATLIYNNKLYDDNLNQTYLTIDLKNQPKKVYYKSGKSIKINIIDDMEIRRNGKYYDDIYQYYDTHYKYLSVSNWDVGTYNIVLKTKNPYAKGTTFKVTVMKATTTVKAPKITAKFKQTTYFKATVTHKTTKKAVKNTLLKIKIGKKTYNIKTNSKGIAKFNTKTLNVGTYNVQISSGNANYKISAKSQIKIRR